MLISRFKKDGEIVNIQDLEEVIGLKLPQEYSMFLQKYNGGETPETEWTGKEKSDIKGFFGYKVDNKLFDIENIINYVLYRN